MKMPWWDFWLLTGSFGSIHQEEPALLAPKWLFWFHLYHYTFSTDLKDEKRKERTRTEKKTEFKTFPESKREEKRHLFSFCYLFSLFIFFFLLISLFPTHSLFSFFFLSFSFLFCSFLSSFFVLFFFLPFTLFLSLSVFLLPSLSFSFSISFSLSLCTMKCVKHPKKKKGSLVKAGTDHSLYADSFMTDPSLTSSKFSRLKLKLI